MAEYEKLEDSKTHFTGPIAGQLYIRFLKFEGLDPSISATNMPAISVQIDNESGLHPHLDFNPKKIVQLVSNLYSLFDDFVTSKFQRPLPPKVPELLLFIRSRLNKVRIEFKHPQSQEDLGTATIEPARVADAKLNTIWFKIGDTAKVLAHVYWGALHIHDKFTNRLTELQLSTFTIVLDRPQYLAGETVTGIVVFRPRKPKDLKNVKLQIAGFSRQLSEDDASYESKHVFFNHEAILMGFAGSTGEAIQVKPGFYIWTFAFPLPYAIPSSGLSCGNFYYIAARQVDMAGNISKSLKLTFGIRKTFFPRDLMEAAIDAPPNLIPHPQQAAVLTSEPGAPASAAPSTEDFEDEMSNVRRSTHIAKLMQSEEDSDSDEGNSVEDSNGGSSEDEDDSDNVESESDEISATVAPPASKPDSDVPKKQKKATSSSSKKKKSSKSSEASKPKKKSKTSASEPRSALKTSNPGKSQSEVEPASNPAPRSSQSQSDDPQAKTSAAGVYKSATVIATGPDGKSSVVMAVQPTLHVNVRVPLRVKPGIGIQVRPSGGMKHLTVPIEVENTTEKALVHFHVALNCITQKTLWQHLFLGGTRPYTIHAKYLIKKFKFKKEPGWPLAPGQKWQGTVTLALPESVPPSIDDAVSPLFSRTYYVKICSAAKGLFTKHKVETKKAVLLPDYDYFTRPLPIQHVFNQPIRFTIFTMPATAVAPTFVTDPTVPSIDHSAAVAVDIEQSEAIDLDTSTVF